MYSKYEYAKRYMTPKKVDAIKTIKPDGIITLTKARIAKTLNIFAPSLCVFLHTSSLDKVHGILIPMKKFFFDFSRRKLIP